MRVLVIDQTYQPISFITPQRAITLLFLGKAEVLHESDTKFRAQRYSISVPSVVKLLKKVKNRLYDKVPFNRNLVYSRDNFACQYCGKPHKKEDLSLDHIVPRSKGGPTSWENVVAACIPCNTRKANRTPREAGMQLLSKPKQPSAVRLYLRESEFVNMPSDWTYYLKTT